MIDLLTINKQIYCISLVLFFMLFSTSPAAQAQNFNQWLNQIEQEAIQQGLSKRAASRAMNHIKFLPKVIKLDRAQPEFINPFMRYYGNHVTPKRVADGRKLLRKYRTLLRHVEKKYGVPKEILVAFWGLETNYGKNLGGIDTLSALATLAYEGRRAGFFKKQLFDALHIIDQQHLNLRYLKGSWAGAFGHMQFMPSTFKQYAIDGDGNRSIDLKRSIPDALYSAAHYLSSVGWDMRFPSIIEVKLPQGFPYEKAHLNQTKTVSQWQALGVTAVQAVVSDARFASMKTGAKRVQKIRKRDETNLVAGLSRRAVKTLALNKLIPNTSSKASVLLPQGWRGPAFMVFDNFHTILDWNRSTNYALSVGLLARQLDQNITLVNGGNAAKGALMRTKIKQLQTMLNNLGFDSGYPDGYPGLQTQSAIRAYQLTQALPADGYASANLFQHIETNAALSE